MERKIKRYPKDAPVHVSQTAQQLVEIEARQDELLRGLDELNAELERTLAEYQSRLKVFRQADEAP
jgi:ribosome-associated translation inhibitor RaiA